MAPDTVLDMVLAVTHAASNGDLLADIDSLTTGLETSGWTRAVAAGQWIAPEAPGWSLLSADHAPNLAVFFFDEDAELVFTAGRELARRLDHDEHLIRHGDDHPNWPSWPLNDPRWAEWTGLQSDWPTWIGGPALISLNVRAAATPGRVRVPPSLHFQIERVGTPPEGLPFDPDRAHPHRLGGIDGCPLASRRRARPAHRHGRHTPRRRGSRRRRGTRGQREVSPQVN